MSLSPDYSRGIIDALKTAADVSQTLLDKYDLAGESLQMVTALRDAFASAALLAEINEEL